MLYIILLLLTPISLFSLPNLQEDSQIKTIFDKHNVNGTFVLYNVSENTTIGYNNKRAQKQFIPGSIFKIPNSAIALSERIITNVDTVFYQYRGEKVFLPVWTNNMSLRDAMKHSNVPAFQQIAKTIELRKMQEYLNKFNYGNKKLGNIVDTFWLEGPLKISALEQVNFLQKLFSIESYISFSIQEQLKDILLLEEKNNWKLYGKTGWPSKIGWFVGWIEKGNSRYFFALNIDLENFEDLPLRQEITEDILTTVIEDYKPEITEEILTTVVENL